MIYREYLSLFPLIKEIMNDELKPSQEMAALEQVVNTTSNYHPSSESTGKENSSQNPVSMNCPNKVLSKVNTPSCPPRFGDKTFSVIATFPPR